MSIKFKMRGLDRFIRQVEQKGKNAQVATEKELRSSSLRIERMAKTKAPVDTGALKGAIFTSKAGKLTYRVTSPQHYSIYLEKGTRKMAAQPFLGPSVDAEKGTLFANLRKIYRR